MAEDIETLARTARLVMQGVDRATLATLHSEGGPYASLVMVARDAAGCPLLLLSDLADHTRNLARDDRVSLLFDGTAGLDRPLAGARLSLLGRAVATDDAAARARYLARHPDATLYAGFGDFRFYRVVPERGHLVAGFGRIRWIDAQALAPPVDPGAVAAAEGDIVAHMSEDHSAAIQLYARAAGSRELGWRMTGVDVEGIDLRLGGQVLRIGFAAPAADAAAVRAELVRLAREARGRFAQSAA